MVIIVYSIYMKIIISIIKINIILLFYMNVFLDTVMMIICASQ